MRASLPARGGRGRLCQPRPLQMLMLVVVCLALLAACSGEAAAPVVGGSVSAPNWRIGDVVPMTVYVRLARQVRRDSWLFNRGADVEDDIVEADEHDGFANDKEAAEARAQDADGAMEDLEMDDDGVLLNLVPALYSGKHRYQIMRALPPSVGPRFAVNKVATLRLHHWFSEAARQIRAGSTKDAPLQSDLALRVSLGRGMRKETTWLPIAVRRTKLRSMGALLFVDAEPEIAAGGKGDKDDGAASVLFLSALRFEFGFQTGATNTITNYGVKAHYAPFPKYAAIANGVTGEDEEGDEQKKIMEDIKAERADVVSLHFNWHEHRAYNPTRAMTLCSGAALIGALVMIAITFNSRSKVSKQFRRRDVAVKERTL